MLIVHDIINRGKPPTVSIVQLFRFSTLTEKFMIIAASVFAIAAGAIQPCSILIYERYISQLTASLSHPDQLLILIQPIINTMAYMGTAVLISVYLANCLWVMTGESQTRRIRSLYLHAVLRQNMEWFDQAGEDSLNTRLAADTQMIQDGISGKFGLLITLTAQFIAGRVVSFVEGWRLAILSFVVLPLMAITVVLMSRFMRKYIKLSQDSYADAGSVAKQTFNSIRTVFSFSLQSQMLARYEVDLEKARKMGVKRGQTIGTGFAFFSEILTGPNVLVIFLAMMMGCLAFIRLPTNLSAVTGACGAVIKVFEVIDRVPEIDPDSTEGIIPKSVKGAIEFSQVSFKYPTRPDLTILKSLSLKIERPMVASTTRCSQPRAGLVNMSIRQNLLMGSPDEVSNERLIEACKEANCHLFITQLPQGYDTLVGDHGSMLSGGQKQRIAIARAILKNPTVLLLDEATSALDTQSERLVQQALDKASAKRTTVVVAHPLSTVRNADLIVVMDHGDIIECGTHSDLVKTNGVYADLVYQQTIDTNNSDDLKEFEQEEADAQRTLVYQDMDVEDLKRLTPQKPVLGDNVDLDAYELKLKKDKEERKMMMKQKAPTWKVLQDMRPEWWIVICGALASVIAGGIFPIYWSHYGYDL
ncbi:unnamed protein product [Rhizopus stolonifer]